MCSVKSLITDVWRLCTAQRGENQTAGKWEPMERRVKNPLNFRVLKNCQKPSEEWKETQEKYKRKSCSGFVFLLILLGKKYIGTRRDGMRELVLR